MPAMRVKSGRGHFMIAVSTKRDVPRNAIAPSLELRPISTSFDSWCCVARCTGTSSGLGAKRLSRVKCTRMLSRGVAATLGLAIAFGFCGGRGAFGFCQVASLHRSCPLSRAHQRSPDHPRGCRPRASLLAWRKAERCALGPHERRQGASSLATPTFEG